MKSLAMVPNGYDEVVRVYGNPDVNNDWALDPGWLAKNVIMFPLKYPLRKGGGLHTLPRQEVLTKFWTYGQKYFNPQLLGSYYGKSAGEVGHAIIEKFAMELNPKTYKHWYDKQVFVCSIQCHRLVGEAFVDGLTEFFEVVGEDIIRAERWDECSGFFNFRTNSNAVPKRLSTHSWAISGDFNSWCNPNGQVEDRQPPALSDALTKRGFVRAHNDWMHYQGCKNF